MTRSRLRSSPRPVLRTISRNETPTVLIVVLHGGPEQGTSRCHWFLPQVLRCLLLARWTARRWNRDFPEAAAVFVLQHAWTGWDGDGRDPVADARWALAELQRRHPDVPVALLGHSMGGRVAVRVADDDHVVGVVGLAPWLPAADSPLPLAGKTLSVVQGSRDRELPIETTVDFMARARRVGVSVRQAVVTGGGHAMLYRIGRWNRYAVAELHLLVAD